MENGVFNFNIYQTDQKKRFYMVYKTNLEKVSTSPSPFLDLIPLPLASFVAVDS